MTTEKAEAAQLSDEAPERETCPDCHGEGEFVCINGCHTRECWGCDGEGTV